MAAVILALVLIPAVFLLIALVVTGVRRENPRRGFDTKPPTPLTAFTRRLLGVYVRKDDHDGTARIVQSRAAVLGRR